MSAYPFTRRNPFAVSRMPAATQRSIICPTAPALDVPFDEARAADEAFHRIGRGQRPTQPQREFQREDGQRFVESFAEALGGTGLLRLRTTGEIEEEPLGRLGIVELRLARAPPRRPTRFRSISTGIASLRTSE